MRTIYTIPFTKAKVNELSQYFAEPVGFTVKDMGAGGRRYTCSIEEFRDMGYDELISLKTGFTEYLRSKVQPQLKEGGVR